MTGCVLKFQSRGLLYWLELIHKIILMNSWTLFGPCMYNSLLINIGHSSTNYSQKIPHSSPMRWMYIRVDSRFAPSQWETSLQSNVVSHWLGTNLESALYIVSICTTAIRLVTFSHRGPANQKECSWVFVDMFLSPPYLMNVEVYNEKPYPVSLMYNSRRCLGINTLRPRQNGRHFPDDNFKCIFLNENVWRSIKISLKFVCKGPINNIPALVQIMAWQA